MFLSCAIWIKYFLIQISVRIYHETKRCISYTKLDHFLSKLLEKAKGWYWEGMKFKKLREKKSGRHGSCKMKAKETVSSAYPETAKGILTHKTPNSFWRKDWHLLDSWKIRMTTVSQERNIRKRKSRKYKWFHCSKVVKSGDYFLQILKIKHTLFRIPYLIFLLVHLIIVGIFRGKVYFLNKRFPVTWLWFLSRKERYLHVHLHLFWISASPVQLMAVPHYQALHPTDVNMRCLLCSSIPVM